MYLLKWWWEVNTSIFWSSRGPGWFPASISDKSQLGITSAPMYLVTLASVGIHTYRHAHLYIVKIKTNPKKDCVHTEITEGWVYFLFWHHIIINKIPKKNILEAENFILTHYFRDISVHCYRKLWWLQQTAMSIHMPLGQKAEGFKGYWYQIPPPRHWKCSIVAGKEAFKTWVCVKHCILYEVEGGRGWGMVSLALREHRNGSSVTH